MSKMTATIYLSEVPENDEAIHMEQQLQELIPSAMLGWGSDFVNVYGGVCAVEETIRILGMHGIEPREVAS